MTRMSMELFTALRRAIDAVGGLTPEATARQRWDAVWRANFILPLYDAGLDDVQIDAALRRIAAGGFYRWGKNR